MGADVRLRSAIQRQLFDIRSSRDRFEMVVCLCARAQVRVRACLPAGGQASGQAGVRGWRRGCVRVPSPRYLQGPIHFLRRAEGSCKALPKEAPGTDHRCVPAGVCRLFLGPPS